MWSSSYSQVRYSVIDLGTLGGSYSRAYAISDSGFIVGVSSLASGEQHPFLYQNGVMTDLGLLPGLPPNSGENHHTRTASSEFGINGLQGSNVVNNNSREKIGLRPLGSEPSSANGVNNLGQVVGNSILQDNQESHGFLYQNGTMMDIGTISGNVSVATGINDSGYVVGYSDIAPISSPKHAFRYRNGIMADLGTIGYIYSFAYGINKAGDVVGGSTRADSTNTSFLYQNDTMIDIGRLPGGLQSEAHAINNFGHVVGYSNLPISGQHAYIYRNGVMTDLGALGILSWGLGINDSDQVVGWTYIASSTIHACLWEADAIKDMNTLIDPGSGWVLQYAYGINNRGEIVGAGTHNGQTHAFLLVSPKLKVTRPAANELWIAGEADTIRWTSIGIDSVNILLSTNYENGAGSFNEIVHGYPADSSHYIWHLPDSILSRKCAIQIENTVAPDPYVVSDAFKIKPYILTRVDENGNYEKYQIGPVIGEDDWIFNNTEANMFPSSWYAQFDYVNGTDPFTHSHYTYDFQSWIVNAHPKDFPDWPSFVQAFGTDQCYFTLNFGGLLKPMAIFYWALMKGSWGGSCYGFAASSFLAFDQKSDFISRFGMPPFNGLRNVQLGDTARKVINEVFTYEYGTEEVLFVNYRAKITRPNETLQEIKQMFLSESGDNRHIDFFDYTGGGAHAVNPWKISKRSDHPELEYIQVYDNNFPDTDFLAFEIDTVQNTWSYPTIAPSASKSATDVHHISATSSTHKLTGLVLSLPSSSYLHDANIPLTPSGARTALAPSLLSVYNSGTASISLKNSTGDSIVYNSKDSSLIVGIAGAVPNIPLTGTPHPPIGYDLPVDGYSISMSDFADSLTYFSVFENGRIIYFGRTDATNSQSDYLSFDTGLGTRNRDSSPKRTNFGSIIAEPTLQKQIDVLNCTMVQGDSMRFASWNIDGFQLVNAGTQKDYDIDLRNVSASGSLRFTHVHIILDSNSTHFISPQWDSLNTTSLKILIDNGNDGTIDDSIFVDNQITSVHDRVNGNVPKVFALYQNYPNPFNPVTTISFDLPNQSYVTLKVYDVLGQEVATLVDGMRQAGRYNVPMNATEQPSGVYFYRLTAGSFSDVKKMVILK